MWDEIEAIMEEGNRDEKMWAIERCMPLLLGPKSEERSEAPSTYAPVVIQFIKHGSDNQFAEGQNQKPIIDVSPSKEPNGNDQTLP